jgi:hypothetical protein
MRKMLLRLEKGWSAKMEVYLKTSLLKTIKFIL